MITFQSRIITLIFQDSELTLACSEASLRSKKLDWTLEIETPQSLYFSYSMHLSSYSSTPVLHQAAHTHNSALCSLSQELRPRFSSPYFWQQKNFTLLISAMLKPSTLNFHTFFFSNYSWMTYSTLGGWCKRTQSLSPAQDSETLCQNKKYFL